MHILASYCSYDDDPCETLDGRGTKKTLKRSEQRNRRDPEVNRVKKRARSSSYFNLHPQTSSDGDPCETLDGRGTKKTLRRSEQEMTNNDADPGSKRDAERARWYQKGPGSKRVGEHKRYLDHAETRRAIKRLGLI